MALVTAAASYAATQGQIQTPTLSRAWPDRADVGDAVTLLGTQLDEAGTTLAVTLGTGVTCPVTRRTDTALDITIPAGARSGYAAVTVTKTLPDGSQVSATSNGVPVLVIWTFFDETAAIWPRGLYHTPDTDLVPGPADDVGVCLKGFGLDWRGEVKLTRVRHDGSAEQLFDLSQDFMTLGGGAQTAIDPFSGQVLAGVALDRSGPDTWYLRNLSTGATLYQFPNDPQGATLIPMAVRFDAGGDLFVATYDQDGRTSIFRFAPGDPITFAFDSPACMIPQGVALHNFCFQGADMAVGGDGTVVYAPCALVAPGSSDEIVRVVPGPGGPQSEVAHLPDLHYSEGTQWHLAGRCNGGILAAGSCWTSECNSTVSIFDLSDGSPVATLDGVGLLGGFSSDGYDDFFVEGVIWHGGGWHLGLRRLTVADLPSGFYGPPPAGVAAAAAHASRRFETPPDPATIPPEWLVKRREPLKPEPPRARRTQSGQPNVGVPGHAPSDRAPTSPGAGAAPTLARTAGLRHLALTTGLYCVRRAGHLVLLVTRDTADQKTEEVAIPSDSRVSTTVLFGQAPLLALGWREPDDSLVPATPSVPVKTAWELVPNSEHVINGAPTALFPERPEIIFAESGLPLLGSSVQFQTVHLGWFDLKVTPSDATYGGPVTIDVNIDVPAGLAGGKPNLDLDQKIIYAANQYGFPPQVIKSQVDVESNHTFDPTTYRYEARTVDYAMISRKGTGFWNDPRYELASYRMPPSTGTQLTADDLEPRNRSFSRISAFDWGLDPPGWPYQCVPFGFSDGPVSIFELVEADDGWARCSFPWMQYNELNSTGICDGVQESHKGPCDRQRWFSWADNHIPVTFMTYYNRFYCGTDPSCADCNASNSEAAWLLNESRGYVAQTPIAASYGLMQVLYTTAVQERHWKEGVGRAAERHPADLPKAETSLDIGVGYDAWLTNWRVYFWQGSKAYASLDAYNADLVTGIGWYNPGNRPPNTSYSRPIVANAKSFKPF